MKKFNCEIVHMKRKYSNYEGVIKRLFSRIFYSIFNKLAEVQIPKGAPDFFLIKRCVRDEILKTKISYNFIRGFLHWSGFSKVLIEFDQIKRKSGKSKFTFIKQLEFALAGIYYYSNKLPVYFFVMSAVVLFFSFIYLLFILIGHFFFGNIDSEFPVTLVSILIFGSISILFNSVILFILFKIFSFSSQKPNYIKENKKEDE
jgi:dolichol-phosphate mannosyltransferase